MPTKKLEKKNNGSGMDITFLSLVLILLAFGLVMLFSASHAYAFYRFGNSLHFILRQSIFAVAGVAAMLFISKFIKPGFLKRYANIIYWIVVGLLVITIFMRPINGAKRWIIIGGITFQPSELAKFAIIVLFAKWMAKNNCQLKHKFYDLVPFGAALGLYAGLLVLEPHLSALILIGSIAAIMMYVGNHFPTWLIFGAAAIGGLLLFLVFFTDLIPYADSRLELWFDPWKDQLGEGFQTVQSLMAIGSGGFFGVGLGQSRQKYMYIPEPHNDFIYSVVCEELGFVGGVIVIALFVALVWRGFIIAFRAKDKFSSLLVVGLTIQVGLQALLNIAVVTNTLPNTGISLPFFSYGGTSLLMLLGQMGIILGVSRNMKTKDDTPTKRTEKLRRS